MRQETSINYFLMTHSGQWHASFNAQENSVQCFDLTAYLTFVRYTCVSCMRSRAKLQCCKHRVQSSASSAVELTENTWIGKHSRLIQSMLHTALLTAETWLKWCVVHRGSFNRPTDIVSANDFRYNRAYYSCNRRKPTKAFQNQTLECFWAQIAHENKSCRSKESCWRSKRQCYLLKLVNDIDQCVDCCRIPVVR